MTTKANPGPFNCYAAAMPDETIFTVLARDPAFPATVRFWCGERIRLGKNETEDDMNRLLAAMQEATTAERWRAANLEGPDGEPTWRTKLSFVTDDTRPIRVEDRAMDCSVKDALSEVIGDAMGMAAKMSTVHRQLVLNMAERLKQVVEAIDANVPCIPSNWDAGPVRPINEHRDYGDEAPTYDRPVRDRTIPRLTPGEKIVIDSAPEDLAHNPEVPQHRFAMFNKGKNYAYARGLEINPSHLPAALDALLVDGWELISLFGQTDSEHVGFVFKRVPPAIESSFTLMNPGMNDEQRAEFEGMLEEYMTKPPKFMERRPFARIVYPDAKAMPGDDLSLMRRRASTFKTPKIEVHVEGMSDVDALSVMSIIECRLQWLPQNYESVQVVGLIANDPEAAFDFTQTRGKLDKRKSLIKGDCSDMEFGRQQEP